MPPVPVMRPVPPEEGVVVGVIVTGSVGVRVGVGPGGVAVGAGVTIVTYCAETHPA